MLNGAFPHVICEVHSLKTLIPTTFVRIPSKHVNTTEESMCKGKFISMHAMDSEL
jgi:hypothetical protein